MVSESAEEIVSREVKGIVEDNRRDELYCQYSLRMRSIEEEREALQRSIRRLQEDREESRRIWEEEKRSLENLTQMWGECEEIGKLRCEFGDSMDGEERMLAGQEEALREEYKSVCRREQAWEEEYRQACRSLTEEEALCQE